MLFLTKVAVLDLGVDLSAVVGLTAASLTDATAELGAASDLFLVDLAVADLTGLPWRDESDSLSASTPSLDNLSTDTLWNADLSIAPNLTNGAALIAIKCTALRRRGGDQWVRTDHHRQAPLTAGDGPAEPLTILFSWTGLLG